MAATWLARFEAGGMEEAMFERWRSAHPDNEIAFARALAVWNRSGGENSDPVRADETNRRQLLRGLVAATMVGVIAVGGWSTRAYAWHSASCAVGERKRVALPDGSVAMLNTDSEVSWRFSKTERSLWINRGEVALELTSGQTARFHGAGAVAFLSAGRFNIRLQPTALDIVVMRGEATAPRFAGETMTRDADTDVVAGRFERLLLMRATSDVQSASPEAVSAAIAWQQGEIVFDNEPLHAAVEEYNRYLMRKIVIADPDLKNIPIGGRFTSTDAAPFLSSLRLGLGLRVTTDEGQIILSR